MRVEDEVAAEYEKDYVIIKTYKKGCPDLVLIPLDLASKIIILEVKGPGDQPRKEQRETIEQLKLRGVPARFHYTNKPKKESTAMIRFTDIERARQNKEYFTQGYSSFSAGIKRRDYPVVGTKGGYTYYRLRSEWLNGWDQAKEDEENR